MEEAKRKHVEQFTTYEIIVFSRILSEIRNIAFDKVKFTWHMRNKINNQKKIFLDGIVSAFYYGYLLEVKVENGSVRLLIRFDDYGKKRATCIVYSLNTKEIVTAWSNNVYDRHNTIDWTAYDQNLDVIKFMEPLTVEVLT